MLLPITYSLLKTIKLESRNKMGKNIVAMLDSLSKEYEIEIGEKVAPMIESELNLEKGTFNKFTGNK